MATLVAAGIVAAGIVAAGLQTLSAHPAFAESPFPAPGRAARVAQSDSSAWERLANQAGQSQSVDDALTALDEILSDPNLQRALTTPAPRPTPSEPLPDVQLPRIGIEVIRLMLAIAGSIGVLALIVALGPTLYRLTVAHRRNDLHKSSPDAEVTTSAEAVARAQRASVVQDYRLAMRLLYLACLLKLDESGVLRYDRTLTNREYVRQLASRPVLAGALQPVVEAFDDVWYGFRALTPQGYAAFEAQVRELLELAVAGRKPANDQP